MSQTVLISGANSGMGLATAVLLAQHGFDVYGGARSAAGREAIVQAAAAGGLRITPLALDVQDRASVESAVATVLERTGRLDALVNNAGYGLVASVEDGTDEEFVRQFDVNVFGVLRMIRAALPAMRAARGGVIVNIGSFLGQIGLPLLTHYNASKYAVEGITDSLRLELSPFGIRVHTVAPGLFRTSFVNKGLAANARTTAPESPYAPLASHLLPAVAQAINEGPDPIAVAQAVLRVLQDEQAPARIPVGTEAVKADELKRMAPADCEAAIRKTFGLPD